MCISKQLISNYMAHFHIFRKKIGIPYQKKHLHFGEGIRETLNVPYCQEIYLLYVILLTIFDITFNHDLNGYIN